MKTWKTVAISVITTASLVTAGAVTYNYLQPSNYEGDKFTNETIVMPNTDNSSDESSSSVTEQSTDGDTEYSEPEQVEYNSLYINNGPCGWKEISRTGFYVYTPMQQTNQFHIVEITTDGDVLDEVVVHGEHPDSDISDLNCASAKQNAENFVSWLREQAPSGHTQNALQSNYDYWVKNCKYKYN